MEVHEFETALMLSLNNKLREHNDNLNIDTDSYILAYLDVIRAISGILDKYGLVV